MEGARGCRSSEPIHAGEHERMFLYCRRGRRVPRRAVPKRAEPRQGYALQVVAEPLHGMRPPLHVLLRPGLRAAGRETCGRPLRHVDPSQDQHRRGAPRRARPARPASGRTSSSCGPEHANTFLEHLAQDWPELLPHYRQLYGRRAYLGAEETKPIRRQVSALAREFGVADRRTTRLMPERAPEQLTLAV